MPKDKKKIQDILNRFSQATIKAAMADRPEIMQASGWDYDKDGNLVQGDPNAEGPKRLASSLAEIASMPLVDFGGELLLNIPAAQRGLSAAGTLLKRYGPTGRKLTKNVKAAIDAIPDIAEGQKMAIVNPELKEYLIKEGVNPEVLTDASLEKLSRGRLLSFMESAESAPGRFVVREAPDEMGYQTYGIFQPGYENINPHYGKNQIGYIDAVVADGTYGSISGEPAVGMVENITKSYPNPQSGISRTGYDAIIKDRGSVLSGYHLMEPEKTVHILDKYYPDKEFVGNFGRWGKDWREALQNTPVYRLTKPSQDVLLKNADIFSAESIDDTGKFIVDFTKDAFHREGGPLLLNPYAGGGGIDWVKLINSVATDKNIRRAAKFADKHPKSTSRLSRFLRSNMPEGLLFSISEAAHRNGWSENPVEDVKSFLNQYGAAPNIYGDKSGARGPEQRDIGNAFLLPPETQEKFLNGLGYLRKNDSDYGLVNNAATVLSDKIGRQVPTYQIGDDYADRKDIIPIYNGYLLDIDDHNGNPVLVSGNPSTMLRHAQNYPFAIYEKPDTGEYVYKAWDLNDYGNHAGGNGTKYYENSTIGETDNQYLANLYDIIGEPFVQTTGYTLLPAYKGLSVPTKEEYDRIFKESEDLYKDGNYIDEKDRIRDIYNDASERLIKSGYVPFLPNVGDFASGGKIHIKPSKRGTFTAAAKKHGKSVQAFASQVLANKENYSPAMVKKANFARNSAKWHADGGSLDNTIDYTGIATTNHRKYNPDYISYIDTSLANADISPAKRASILANIIEESGGNPFALDDTGKFYGLLQWADDRYKVTGEKDPYKEIDNQVSHILNTLGNTTDKVSWTHGGTGSGYNSYKDAMTDFDSNDLATAMKGFTLGYVRPTGKMDSYNNRLKVAEQLLQRYNSTPLQKVTNLAERINKAYGGDMDAILRLIGSAKGGIR